MAFLNVAFYRFVPLSNTTEWRDRLREKFLSLELRGTVILAEEGMNGFLCGKEESAREAIEWLKSHKEFEALTVKESYSERNSFRRLAFKLKPEIVTFKVPGCTPLKMDAPRLEPEELNRWYDEGKKFVIIDTRNDYEFRLGQFENSVCLNTRHFVQFAEAAKTLPQEWKEMPVVTFCTGGIRCEKAAPYLKTLGFQDVYQLEGGILNYFEKVGGAHWNGECFVFDGRIAVNPDLAPTGAYLCPHCIDPTPKDSPVCIHCGK